MQSKSDIYNPFSRRFCDRLNRFCLQSSYRDQKLKICGGVSAVQLEIPAAVSRPVRLAFASDFHYSGSENDLRQLNGVRQLIASFQPEILLLGGDLVRYCIHLKALEELLASLRETAPEILAVPGNWEGGKVWLKRDYWKNLYAKYGMRYLCNESAIHGIVQIFGLEDSRHGSPVLPETWAPGKFHLLLVHRPDVLPALEYYFPSFAEIDLALCGHTHGGQVRLPLIGPVWASSIYHCKFAYGTFRHVNGRLKMFVSSGLSQGSFPWRFRCRREIVFVTLIPQNKNRGNIHENCSCS